ncbi:MAG TPA: hypothetical protein VF055_06830 [Steroidobacteraceae bacterium]
MAQPKRLKGGPVDRQVTAREASNLQVNEDMRFQERDWLGQRVGWFALASLLLAGCLGLMGSGPLSQAERSDGRGFTIEYERFVRHGAQTSVVLRAASDALPAEQARITVTRQFLAANDLQRSVPEPSETRARGAEVELVYSTQSRKALQVRWIIEPDELGRHTTILRLNDGPPLEIVQFTYP